MYIDSIKVDNYKCLRGTGASLSRFSTIIGPNNSGKSSFLQALIMFVRGTKLSRTDFYDPDKEIIIRVNLTEVGEGELRALAEEHRQRVKDLLAEGRLTLVRHYKTDGSSTLRCVRLLPKDPRFRADSVNELLRGQSGASLRTKVEEAFPELKGKITATTQTFARQQIEELATSFPKEALEEQEADLPTGIDNSIKALLPEPVYIPAVKDLSDDIKTRESASFGRLLAILLSVIEPQLQEAKELFASLTEKLNRTEKDGKLVDNRLQEVKEIEALVQNYVQENFPKVSLQLEIPPPEMKAVLSNARILLDDGVAGLVESKGDGLKRAVTFAILRSYVTLSQKPGWGKGPAEGVPRERYLFLYEEPELYLHPTSQMVLYEALQQISREHQVVLTTHSPLFLTPQAEGAFLKMVKKDPADGCSPPHGECLAIDLSDLAARDQFQLICFDNNNVAFFADTVVLVEGDSDYICLRHLARTLNKGWDFDRKKYALVKVNGKGSFPRYREFFGRFRVQTFVIADLDVIVRDFDKLGLLDFVMSMRSDLLRAVDACIPSEAGGGSTLDGEGVKKVVRQMGWREQWDKAKEIVSRAASGQGVTEDDKTALGTLFDAERDEPRLQVLKTHPDVQGKKLELLGVCREHGVFILEKGSIDDYYPAGVHGGDKPSKAQDFCRQIGSAEAIRTLCSALPVPDGNVPEFHLIFQTIFSGAKA